MLQFDADYFKEENRLDFTIPAFMKHAWAAQLEMLSLVDRICEENNIPYFADWGTLLGTIRHKGYIPWDDDIDLCMKRKDLRRFCEVVDNYEGINVSNAYNSPDFGLHATRVYNTENFCIDRRRFKDYHGFPFPVGMDIFTLDYVPRDKALEEEQVEALQVCSTAFHTREWLDDNDVTNKAYAMQLAEYKAAVKWLEDNCGVQFMEENPTRHEITILNEEIQGLYGDSNSDCLTEMPCICNGRDYYIPKEYYEESVRMSFENVMIPVPKEYDYILRKKYGDDYMTPVMAGCGHDYPFYNTFIKAIYDEKKHKTFEGACEYIQNISSRFYVDFLNKTTATAINISKEELTTDDKVVLAAKQEVLEEFKRVCAETDIPYVMTDDNEVAIRREDVSELLSSIGGELSPWFNYSSLYSSENHEDMRIYIWSDSYLCDLEDYKARFHGCDEEVMLPISIIDAVNDDEAAEEARKELIVSLIKTASSMPNMPTYSIEIIAVANEWSKITHFPINTERNLRREFLLAADGIASSYSQEDSAKVRITAELQDGIDKVYPREGLNNKNDSLIFDESFFEEEERLGFIVSSAMKRAWAAQLEVLHELDRVCELLGVQYFAFCGTLLGAIRHQGFVPWDDDIDVCMLRSDYYRFLREVPDVLGKYFDIASVYNDPDKDVIKARIINSRHINFDKDFLERFHKCPFVNGIDIFPIDNIPDDEAQFEELKQSIDSLLRAEAEVTDEVPYSDDVAKVMSDIESNYGMPIDYNNRPRHEIKKLCDIMSALYVEDETKEVGNMLELAYGQDKFTYDRNVFRPLKRILFENTTVPIMEGYEDVLKVIYGDDYMTPVNTGSAHEYPFYRSQIMSFKEVLEKEYNKEFTYEFVEEFINTKVDEVSNA